MNRNRFPPTGPRGFRQDDSESQIDLATSAAVSFVEEYYKAANSYRFSLASYYVPTAGLGSDKANPSILFNGNELADGKAIQEVFEKQTPRSQIELETVDCHIINPNYPVLEMNGRRTRSNIQPVSLLVTAGGIFKAGNGRDTAEEDFNDSLILVPNPDTAPSRSTRSNARKAYLIQSQIFRLVSGGGHQPANGSFAQNSAAGFGRQG